MSQDIVLIQHTGVAKSLIMWHWLFVLVLCGLLERVCSEKLQDIYKI